MRRREKVSRVDAAAWANRLIVCWPLFPERKRLMSMHRMVKALVATAALGGWLAIGTPTFAADAPPQHVRCTLESVQGQALSVKTARGTESIKLADDAKLFLVSPADLSAVKDGKFVGITSVEKGGKRVAVEVHVFDDTLRGLGEGHYPWDLGTEPNMMTNANIAKVESMGEIGRASCRERV